MAFVGEYQHRRKAVSPTSTETDMKSRKPSPMKKTYEYRAYPTTKQRKTFQKCSGCSEIVPKQLSDRVHDCPCCGLVLDRDHNAAINIKKAAVALREGAVDSITPETLETERSAEPCKSQGTEASNKPQPFTVG